MKNFEIVNTNVTTTNTTVDATVTKATTTICDFGHKIGDARKDLVKLRKENGVFSMEMISEWTDVERTTEIVKKNVFPKLDYKKLKDDGFDPAVIYLLKKVYDGLITKPNYAFEALHHYYDSKEQSKAMEKAQEKYIQYMNVFRSAFNDISKDMSVKKVATDIMAKILVKIQGVAYVMTRKVLTTLKLGICNPDALKEEAIKKGFLMSDMEKILKDYHVRRYLWDVYPYKEPIAGLPCLEISLGLETTQYVWYFKKEEYRNIENWIPKTYYIWNSKSNEIIGINFKTEEEASDFAKKLVEETFQKNEPTGKTGEKVKKATEKKVLSKPVQLEHVERIGIGFDYRQGKNVTTDDMLNTFNFYGGEFGNWLSKKSANSKSKKLSDAQANLNMSFDAFMDIATALDIQPKSVSFNGVLSIAYGSRGRGNASAHYEPARAVINLTKLNGAGCLGHEWAHALDHYVAERMCKIQLFETESINSVFDPVIEAIERDAHGRKTKFYSDACAIDGLSRKRYWSSNVELFARAFHCYLLDKLKEKGIRSDYLCGTAEQAPIGGNHFTYPQGEERKRINHEFDMVISKLKEMNILI